MNDEDLLRHCTLAVLAGGEGSRMGRPKGLLTIAGRPILSFLHEQIAWLGPTLLVTAPGREHPPGANLFSREVQDPVPGGGPLQGILTALQHVATPLLVVTTVDMPMVRQLHLLWLLQAMRDRAEMLGMMIQHGECPDAQIEPFPSVYRAKAREMIAERLAAGRRSVHRLLEEPGFMSIAAPAEWNDSVWTNLNSPQDLASFVAALPNS